jgi:hypothetical protein
MATSREELLALAAQLDAEGPSQHVQFRDANVSEQPFTSVAALRRRRACELVRAGEAAKLLGLVVVSTSQTSLSTSTSSTPPAWPRSEVPVLPPPKSLKRSAAPPKVARAFRNGVVARLAAEHALLFAAAAATTPTANAEAGNGDAPTSSSTSPSSLTSFLVEAVRASAPLRRAAALAAFRQEQSSVFDPSTGKETYLSRARAATALSARTSAAEVRAALLLHSAKKKRKDAEDDDDNDDETDNKNKKARNPAPDPNPKSLPLLRREREEKEEREGAKKNEREEEKEPLPLEEVDLDWRAPAPTTSQSHDPSLLPSPRSAISAVVSAALAPFAENRQVSQETARAASARAVAKVLASFSVTPAAVKAEKRGKLLNAAVAAFLTDSQRGKIAEFARKCLDAEEKKQGVR